MTTALPARTVPQILDDAVHAWSAANGGALPSTYQIVAAWRGYVPTALSDTVRIVSQGYIDPTPVADAADAILSCFTREQVDSLEELIAWIFANFGLGGIIVAPIVEAVLASPLTPTAITSLKNAVLNAFHNGIIVIENPTVFEVSALNWSATPAIPMGYSEVCQARSLDDAIARAFNEGLARVQEKIAKWGGASLLEASDPNVLEVGVPVGLAPLAADSEPDVAALGFATLVRDDGPEVAVFNLAAPAGGAGQTLVDPAPTAANGAPLAPSTTLQYRPFENRGLEGRLLLEFPALDPSQATGGVGPIAGIDGTAAVPALLDLLLDVRFRACYDPDLAATVRSSRSRQADIQSLVGQVAGKPFAFPAPTLEQLGEVRTVHFSLRAHRDRTLQAWSAAFQEIGGLGGGRVPVDPTAIAPLSRVDGFAPLRAASKVFTLRLSPGAPSVLDLDALETTLEVTLQDLGLPADALTRGAARALDPEIVEMGVAVIPTNSGVSAYDPNTMTVTPSATATVTPSSQLTGLIGTTPIASSPSAGRIWMRDPTTAPSPKRLSSFAGTPGNLAVDLTTLLPTGTVPANSPLYDVILSVSLRLPAPETTTR